MAEFFLELFSEKIPAELQKSLRQKVFDDFKNLFNEKLIKSKKSFSRIFVCNPAGISSLKSSKKNSDIYICVSIQTFAADFVISLILLIYSAL